VTAGKGNAVYIRSRIVSSLVSGKTSAEFAGIQIELVFASHLTGRTAEASLHIHKETFLSHDRFLLPRVF
jgi:hypothetical protein